MSGLPVISPDACHQQQLSPEYKLSVSVIGHAILSSRPSGTIRSEDLPSLLDLMGRAERHLKTGDGRYVLIEDAQGLTGSVGNALARYWKHLNKVAAIVLCNVPPRIKAALNISRHLHAEGIDVQITDDYADAIDRARGLCMDHNLDAGPLVFDPVPALSGGSPSLTPLRIQQCGNWSVHIESYANRSVLIDGTIMYSTSEGYLVPDAIEPINQLRLDVRAATPRGDSLDYIVVDARAFKGGDRRARKQYTKNLIQWNARYPLKMFIAIGANTFMRTAMLMARPFLPFRVAAVADVSEAFELVCRDRAGDLPAQQPAVMPMPHQQGGPLETDAILGYIGAIDWEKKGIDVEAPFDRQHPFYPITQAIQLIKAELDDLLLERDIAERAQLESERKYRELFEKGSDWLCVHDLDGNFLETNFAFKDEVDWDRIQSSQPQLKDIIPERFHPELEDYIRRIRDTGYDRGILNIVAADGRERVLEYKSVLTNNDKGRPEWVKSSARDITSEMKAAVEKERLQKKLQQSQKMESIGTLAGGIAHDFNNILSSVIGFTELAVEDAGDNAKLQDSLQEVLKAGHRAKELVHQILTFARQSDEKQSPIQFSLIAKEVVKMLRSTFPVNIDIKQRIESDALIMGNPTQIQQILMNLCTNAAQAMEERGGFLDIRLAEETINAGKEGLYGDLPPGIYLKLTVSDTGPGIRPGIIDHIFEPYFSTKAPDQGTGMGLAIVHGIVTGYGGDVHVTSRLGAGAVFTVLIPTVQSRRSYTPPEAPSASKGEERILFVDDEYPILKVGGRLLERLGYSVHPQSSGLEALSLFSENPHAFDLVITDMTLPDLTGDRLASKMLNIRADLPIIMCTGFNKNMSERRAREIGVKALMYKPLGKQQLAAMIRRVLDQ